LNSFVQVSKKFCYIKVFLNDERRENMGLARAMEDSKRGEYVSKDEFVKKIETYEPC